MLLSTIRFEEAKPRIIAVVRGRTAANQLASAIPAACGEVWAYARSAHLTSPGRHVAVYLDNAINFECGVEVAEPFQGNGRVLCSATPEGLVATVTLVGAYSGLGAAHAAVTSIGASANASPCRVLATMI